MDEQHRRRAPQHAVAALGIFAPQAFEHRHIAINARHEAAQPRPHERMQQPLFECAENPERIFRDSAQLRRVGHQRIPQLAGIARRRGAVRRRNDAVQQLLRHGARRKCAVRPPHGQQQFHLLGRGHRAVIHRMHPLGRKLRMVHRPRGAGGHAMSAKDAVFGFMQRHVAPGFFLHENLRRAHLHAAAAADAARIIHTDRIHNFRIFNVVTAPL